MKLGVAFWGMLLIGAAAGFSFQGFNPVALMQRLVQPMYEKISENVNNAVPLDVTQILLTLGQHFPLCNTCKVIATILTKTSYFHGNPLPTILTPFCTLRYDTATCSTILKQQSDILLYIVRNSKHFEDKVCNLILQGIDDNCGSPWSDWNVNIHEKNLNSNQDFSLSSRQESIRVGHITDIHYDSKYSESSPTECRQTICCRENKISTSTKGTPLGFVGNCDIPLKLVESGMADMKSKNPEYIYFTGDIVAHNIAETSYEANREEMRTIFNEFKKYFGDIPVLPTLGNHEQHVLNQYSPKNAPRLFSSQWLYDFISEEWPKLISPTGLTSPNLSETIKKGGYYTHKLDSGLRIIVLNNNVCYRLNWWVLLDAEYLMMEQLQWLENVLYEAEGNKEYVHVLMHICPGSECSNVWNRQYHRLIDRYQRIVKAQFCGHSHFEELRIMKNKKNKSIGAVFNGGSLTTYRTIRPNYRILEVDPKSADVIDYTSYYLPIDLNVTDWRKFYSFRESYGVANLSLANVNLAYKKIMTNGNLARMYLNHKYRGTPVWILRACSKECLKNQISEIDLEYPSPNNRARLYEFLGSFE